jgi:hypothetical protein
MAGGGGSRLLGAEVIFGLERVKTVGVVSQRAFLVLLLLLVVLFIYYFSLTAAPATVVSLGDTV